MDQNKLLNEGDKVFCCAEQHKTGKASKAYACSLSLRQICCRVGARLVKKGNGWVATLTIAQRKALILAILLPMSIYFVLSIGNVFISDSKAKQGLPPLLDGKQVLQQIQTEKQKSPQVIQDSQSLPE